MKNTRNSNTKLNIVGDKIRYFREKNNLSYQKLSDKLMILGIDIHKQSIYRIEKGLRTIVDYELCGFAKCFNISIETLVSDYMNNL